MHPDIIAHAEALRRQRDNTPYPLPWYVHRTDNQSLRIVAANSAIVADMFDWADDPGVMEAAQRIVASAGRDA